MATAALAGAHAPGLALRKVGPVALLALYAGVLFFVGLGYRDLTSSHEGRAAQNAQAMLDDGRWLLPHLFDGTVELQKPPLYYWLVALSAWLGGGRVDPWAVRLPAAAAALGTVLFLALLGSVRRRPLAGVIAGLVLATCVHFTWLARVGRIDMPLTFAVTVALGGVHIAGSPGVTARARRGWLIAAYSAIGLGLLLKGPVAAVFVLIVAATWRVSAILHQPDASARDAVTASPADATGWSTRPHAHAAWGLLLSLAIAAPWFIWANHETGGRLWDVFFWYHNVERGLGGAEALASHPCWFYLPRSAVDLFPWSVLLPLVAVWWWRDGGSRRDPLARAGVLWFAGVFLFLSAMSFKRADYLLPAYPGFALFVGAVAERWWHYCTTRPQHASGPPLPRSGGEGRMVTSLVVGGILAAYLMGWLLFAHRQRGVERPYEAIARQIPRLPNVPVIFFRSEAHALAFHLGAPTDTILEWENLEVWANQVGPIYFVMPEGCARDWRDHLRSGELVEVLRARDWGVGADEHPFVVMRSRGTGR